METSILTLISLDICGSILVTGAAGFVGRAVAGVLRSKGLRVVTHARRAAPDIDWAADLGGLVAVSRPIPSDISAVVHCAAAIPARSVAFVRDNSAATAQLAAMLAEISSLKCVVHISSMAVYERPKSGPWIISEDADVVNVGDPGTEPYAGSKRASELALSELMHRGVKVTHLRASSIYGPGMAHTTLLPVLVARALRHDPLQLLGPRNYTQNFVHVLDVAELTAALVVEGCPVSAVNGFSDDTFGLLALAEMIRTRLTSRSDMIDGTQDVDLAAPVFVNMVAKRLCPTFRRLADNLFDAA